MTALPRPLLYLVTDRRAAREPLAAAVARAVEGGVHLVQVREKDLSAQELLRLVEEVRLAVAGRALVLVNDRLDVALAADADGVHLPGNSLPPPAARRLLGPRLLGRSVHSAEEAAEVEHQGVDYLLLGTIFPTNSKPGHPGAGLELVRQTRARCSLPLIAIGGLNADNAASAIEAGADGVATISAILGAADPAAAAARLREAVETAWARREALTPALSPWEREPPLSQREREPPLPGGEG
ncbi:MAG: thiamine phosphate synthase, partial [Chloroflexi bacterium]|nr:thiamine phosphate synthase [Chloroflexota bacterium]